MVLKAEIAWEVSAMVSTQAAAAAAVPRAAGAAAVAVANGKWRWAQVEIEGLAATAATTMRATKLLRAENY